MMVVFIILVIFASLFPEVVSGQSWQRVAIVEGSISYIGFNPYTVNSRIGFAGTYTSDERYSVYRTSDRGESWRKLDIPLVALVTDMTFKDSLVGWMTTGLRKGGTMIYHTTDGGETWNPQKKIEQGSAIYYHKSTGQLFASIWLDGPDSKRYSLTSTDEGLTWHPWNTIALNGYAFTDSLHGIVTCVALTYSRTKDGGKTWESLEMDTEAWQPLAIEGTSTYFVASENTGEILRTDDHGLTWRTLFTFDEAENFLTGDIKGNRCLLILQASRSWTAADSRNGFFTSSDEGVSWLFIGGPPNGDDTRFALVGNSIIAGESHLIKHDSNGIWKYDFPLGALGGELKFELAYSDRTSWKGIAPGESRMAEVLCAALPSEVEAGAIVSLRLQHNHDVVRIYDPMSTSGWEVISFVSNNGVTEIELKRTNDPFVHGSLLRFWVSPYLSLDSVTSIHITGAYVSSKSTCVSNAIAQSSIGLGIDLSGCSDSILYERLADRKPFEITSTFPNPLELARNAKVELFSLVEVMAEMSIISHDGKLCATTPMAIKAGRQSIPLQTQTLGSGSYILRIRSELTSSSVRFVVTAR